MRFAGLFAMLALAGCAKDDADDEDTALVEESVDSAITGQQEGGLLATIVDGTASASTAETAAAIQTQLAAKLQPPGCATVTTAGATATLTFNNCSGPHGLVAANGSISVVVTAATPSSVAFTATATDFMIGEGAFDLAVTGTYAQANASQSIAIASTTTGTGPLGHMFTHAGNYTASWTTACATVDGAWSTMSDVGTTKSLAVSLSRCTPGCPTGAVTRTGSAGRTIAITFDGTATAAWTTNTRTGSVALHCTP